MLTAVRRIFCIALVVSVIWVVNLQTAEYTRELPLWNFSQIRTRIHSEFNKLSDVDAANAYLEKAIPKLQAICASLLRNQQIARLYSRAITMSEMVFSSVAQVWQSITPIRWEAFEKIITSQQDAPC